MRRALLLLPLAACGPATPAATTLPPGQVVFEGMCDASAAVEIDPGRFIVADDEDNVLRVYDADRGGRPLASVDVSEPLGLEPKGKKRKMPELDLEAGTRIGDRAYWITSHGRNSKAKLKPERLRFFATTVPTDDHGADLHVIGRGYDGLIDHLIADPRFAAFDLAAAAARAPKDEGGLNLEGMTATPDGTLLLGFRNPVPDGQALLFELRTPEAVVAPEGEAAPVIDVGDPIRLDLGGHGVRALTWWRGQYLIVAGPRDGGAVSRLYRWDGKGTPTALAIALDAINPEATFTPEGRDAIMLLSDDGTLPIAGVPCKELQDPAAKRFRGRWVQPAR